MQSIAILGGTFNPIHNGHINLAQKAMEQYDLDGILIMPNNKPDYKSDKGIASAADRCHMIQLAIEDYPYMSLSDFEIARDGITYTSDTLRLLSDIYKDTKWYFIMGADSLFYFHKWRKPEEILMYAHILAAVRNDISTDAMRTQIEWLKERYNPCNISLLKCDYVDVSSSHIRQSIRNGIDIRGMVPEGIADYIIEKGLYTDGQD